MKKANINKQIRKTTKAITKKINRAAKTNPTATVAVAGAIATTSVVGTATLVTGLIRLPGMLKKRFAKVDLGTDNQNNNDATTNTTTNDTTTTDTTTDTTTTTADKK